MTHTNAKSLQWSYPQAMGFRVSATEEYATLHNESYVRINSLKPIPPSNLCQWELSIEPVEPECPGAMTHKVSLCDTPEAFRKRIPEGARLNFPWLARDAYYGIYQAVNKLHMSDGYDPERGDNYQLEMKPQQCVAYRRPEWQRVGGAFGELVWSKNRWEFRSKGMIVAYWHMDNNGKWQCEETEAHQSGIEGHIRNHCETCS